MVRVPVTLKRSGIETKLVLPAGPIPVAHKRSIRALQEAVLKALTWNEELLGRSVKSLTALAKRNGVDPNYASRIYRLAFLAPDIMEAISTGRVPETISLETLRDDIPYEWPEQRRRYGFPARRSTQPDRRNPD